MNLDSVTLGFVPLVDSAILVAAREKGFAEAEGLRLERRREMCWAAIRDKVDVGLLDGAHMLAGIPPAVRLGFAGGAQAMIAPMALGLGAMQWSFPTISTSAWSRPIRRQWPALLRFLPAR